MSFESHKTTIYLPDGTRYELAICFNYEFYHAQISNPPSKFWNLSGIGVTEEEAINSLITKIQNSEKLTSQAG